MSTENDEVVVEDSSTELDLSGGQTQEPGQQQQQQQTDPNADLKAAMLELTNVVKQQATPKETPKQLSQEELQAKWAIYNPEATRKDFFQKFFRLNPDATAEEVQEAKALFTEMHQGLVKQAVVGARNLLMEELQKLREEFNPIQEHVSQQRAEKTRERFFETAPALKDERFAAVLDATARSLAGQEFKDEAEYFKVLAESTAKVIKGVLPDFDLGAVQTEKQKPGSTPRLPRASVGGTGGISGGGGAGKSGAKDDSDSIF